MIALKYTVVANMKLLAIFTTILTCWKVNKIAIQRSDNMKSTVKVQETKTNTFINLPKEMKEALGIKKGDTLLLKVIDGKIVIEK